MRSTILIRTVRLTVAAAALLVGTGVWAQGHAQSAAAASNREIRLRDDCDPATFNAALGAGACVGNGDTTVDEFNAELARRGSVNAWKYDPNHQDIKNGETATLVNRGGETHTFTHVAQFGGGFVAPLNQASGNPVPAPECATVNADGSLTPKPAGPQNIRVPGGTTLPAPAIATGTQFYQCCIHPWMRITVNRRN